MYFFFFSLYNEIMRLCLKSQTGPKGANNIQKHCPVIFHIIKLKENKSNEENDKKNEAFIISNDNWNFTSNSLSVMAYTYERDYSCIDPYSGYRVITVPGNTRTRESGPFYNKEKWSYHNIYTFYHDESGRCGLQRLSPTKYWDNYNNESKTAQKIEIGIEKSITTESVLSVELTASLGYEVDSAVIRAASNFSTTITASAHYSKTIGTSSTYEINTDSKNGYYTIVHCNDVDIYSVDKSRYNYHNDGKTEGPDRIGKAALFSSEQGYDYLWYSTRPLDF